MYSMGVNDLGTGKDRNSLDRVVGSNSGSSVGPRVGRPAMLPGVDHVDGFAWQNASRDFV